MRKILSVMVVLAFVFSTSVPAFATVTGSWSNTSGGAWSTDTNWSTNPSIPGGLAGDSATIESITASAQSVTLTAETLGSLNIGGTQAFTVSGGTLSFESSSGSAGTSLTQESTSGANIISSNISLEDTGGLAIANDSGSLLTLSGGISPSSGSKAFTNDGTGAGGVTISGAVTGSTSVNQDSSTSTLVLSDGSNSYSGATTVTLGTLQVQANGALGSTSGVAVASGGALDLDGTTYSTATALSIIGTGVSTTGALTDSSATAATYAGPVTMTGAADIGGTGNITLTDTTGIAGNFTLTKVGTDTLTLDGTSTSTGSTSINAGTVKVATNGALGTGGITVASNAALDLDGTTYSTSTALSIAGTGVGSTGALTDSSATAATYAGPVTMTAASDIGGTGNITLTDTTGIAGNFTLTKVGTDTLTLDGTSTSTGSTSISAGTVQVKTNGALGTGGITVASGAALDLDGTTYSTATGLSIAGTGVGSTGALTNSSTTAATYAGPVTMTAASDIGGTGNITLTDTTGTAGNFTLTKVGTDTLTLDGTSTSTGATVISAGTLAVGNANALGTGTVTNDATLNLGTTTLALGASYTGNASSNLTLTADSASNYGSFVSTGHAAVFNASTTATVNVQGYIANGAVLEVVNTGGTGITDFPTFTSSDALVSFNSSYVGNNGYVTADRNLAGFASLGSNSNAAAAGHVLDNETNPTGPMLTVLDALELQNTAAQTTAALNTMVPVVDRGAMDNSTAGLNNFIGASIDRAQNVLNMASAGDSESGSGASGVSAGDEGMPNGLWAKQYGSYLSQGTRQGIAGYDAWNTGTAVGIDHLFSDNLTAGVSGGYTYGHVSSDVNNSTTDINSGQITLYSGYQGTSHPYFADLAASYARNWYNGERSITVDPTLGYTANSTYQGDQFGTYVDGGYKFQLEHNINLTPIASLQYTHLGLNSYSETNAGPLNLNVNRQSYNILESGLGASVSTDKKYGWGDLTPEFHAKWLYDFVNDDMVVTSAYSGGGGSFSSLGASPAKDGANIGGKLTFDLKDDISLIADFESEIRDNFYGLYGSLTVRYKF